ncbi:polysaccharide biosynthesis/export family protein [Bosea sp. 117]|uniref:polysaccharide biosynthesis/export family protein n=1 Tax=Bosea sp. 117 TaxID=1125973 RepID=UPI000493C0AC|nr:polysaccharide biosynthesis/export family protein [Bosea sp. 117]
MWAKPRAQAPLAAVAALALCLLPARAPAQDANGYRVGPGDTLAVAVFDQPTLSGRFRIGPEGRINFPLLGELPVAGQTQGEIVARLQQALERRVPADATISIEVVEYAPVFVVGDVERPGQYQYRPGMIALELMALGGGVRRSESSTREAPALQIIALQEGLYGLRLQRFRQQAMRERLSAEAAGAAYAPGRAEPQGPLDIATVERILANEGKLFALRKLIFEQRQKSLDDQRASYQAEISSLAASRALQANEIKLLQQETDIAQSLQEKGMGTRPRVFGLQRELSEMKRNALELESFQARAQQRLLEIDYQKAELKNVRDSEVAEGLRQLDVEIAATEAKIAASTQSLAELGQTQPNLPGAPATIRLSTVRDDAGTHREVAVDELTEVRPRDILRVTRNFGPPPPGREATGPSGFPAGVALDRQGGVAMP